MPYDLDHLYGLFKSVDQPELRAVLLLGYLFEVKEKICQRRDHGLQFQDDNVVAVAAVDCIRKNLEFVHNPALRVCFDLLREQFESLCPCDACV